MACLRIEPKVNGAGAPWGGAHLFLVDVDLASLVRRGDAAAGQPSHTADARGAVRLVVVQVQARAARLAALPLRVRLPQQRRHQHCAVTPPGRITGLLKGWVHAEFETLIGEQIQIRSKSQELPIPKQIL